jgi:hypothetical protein
VVCLSVPQKPRGILLKVNLCLENKSLSIDTGLESGELDLAIWH